MTSPPQLCTCKRTTAPRCRRGFFLDGIACRCEILALSPCVNCDDLLDPDVPCPPCNIPGVSPYCPFGFELEDCQCVKHAPRECARGDLSSDKCTCTESLNPVCGGYFCNLDPYDCNCQCKEEENITLGRCYILCGIFSFPDSEVQILCFDGSGCPGSGLFVANTQECCFRGLLTSFRIGNGPCTTW